MKKNWKMTVAIVIWLLCFVVTKIWSIWGSHAGTTFYAFICCSLLVGLALRFVLFLTRKDKKVMIVTALLFVLVAVSPFIIPKGVRYKLMPQKYEAAAEYIKAEIEKIDISKENSGYVPMDDKFGRKYGNNSFKLDEDGLHYIIFDVPEGLVGWSDYMKVYGDYKPTLEGSPWYKKITDLGNGWYYCSEGSNIVEWYGLDEVR